VGTPRALAFLAPGGVPASIGALLPVPRLVLVDAGIGGRLRWDLEVLPWVCGGVPPSGMVETSDGATELAIGSGVDVVRADGVAVTSAGPDLCPGSRSAL
jgi:hypothetical protein